MKIVKSRKIEKSTHSAITYHEFFAENGS